MPAKLAHIFLTTGEFIISILVHAFRRLVLFGLALMFCVTVLLIAVAAFIHADYVTNSLSACGLGLGQCAEGVGLVIAFGLRQVRVFLNL